MKREYNANKLKITSANYKRINFKYNDKLYSLQVDIDSYEGTVALHHFDNKKWKFMINFCWMDIDLRNLIRMKNQETFKNTIVYKYIDKEYFLQELYDCGVLECL